MPAAIVAPSCWASDAPASWKRVPSTVTTRRSGRSTPSVVIHVAMASRWPATSIAAGSAAAMPSGSAPSEPDCNESPIASAASRQRAPASSTTPARSSSTPASTPATDVASIVARPVRSRSTDVAPFSNSVTARSVPAAASTRWRTSQPSSRVPVARRARTNGAMPGNPAASGGGASAAVYSGSIVMPSYVVVRSRANAASGVSSPVRSRALATAAAHWSWSGAGNSPASTRSVSADAAGAPGVMPPG